jgi:hypothetical protein
MTKTTSETPYFQSRARSRPLCLDMASLPFTMSMKITCRNSIKATYNHAPVEKLKVKLLRKQLAWLSHRESTGIVLRIRT